MNRIHSTLLLTAVACGLLAGIAVAEPEEAGAAMAAPALEIVTLPSPSSPLVAVRLTFNAGSIHDPAGKEGLAALTGLMIGNAGTAERSFAKLTEDLYPMAAAIEVNTDRELTVISGEIHREKLGDYIALLVEAVTRPGFDESDLERNRAQLEAYLTNTLRASSDELLGLETLQQVIYRKHPYGHAPEGAVAGLASIALEDVKDFYGRYFTQANLMLGLAGGYPDGFPPKLAAKLAALPPGEAAAMKLPQPAKFKGRRFTLVDKATGSVGIHFGFPLTINRSHPDYYPLMVANSYLGEHRTFHGRLMQQLRGKRGLNYGDYSYIEYWHQPPFTTNPSPGVPRRQQYFSVWVRPVVPETAHFALRAALFEVDRLIERGLTAEEFELARDFLLNYSKLWAQTLSNRLGFLMDSRFYGMGYYIDEVDERLRKLNVEDVNAAVRKHLQTENFKAVIVTADAADLMAKLEKDAPSPMKYNSEQVEDVLETDKAIEGIKIEPAAFEIVSAETMF